MKLEKYDLCNYKKPPPTTSPPPPKTLRLLVVDLMPCGSFPCKFAPLRLDSAGMYIMKRRFFVQGVQDEIGYSILQKKHLSDQKHLAHPAQLFVEGCICVDYTDVEPFALCQSAGVY